MLNEGNILEENRLPLVDLWASDFSVIPTENYLVFLEITWKLLLPERPTLIHSKDENSKATILLRVLS